MPVQMPDEVSPPHHLANESLHTGQRHLTLLPREDHPVDDLVGIQQTKIERHGQQGVGHGPVPHQCRILIRPEGSEAVGHEVLQGCQRLGPRGGEAPWAIAPHEDETIPFPTV